MAPQQKGRLRALTAEEQAALARVQQATSGRHDEVQRATALLAVAARASFAAAALGAGRSRPTPRQRGRRWWLWPSGRRIARSMARRRSR